MAHRCTITQWAWIVPAILLIGAGCQSGSTGRSANAAGQVSNTPSAQITKTPPNWEALEATMGRKPELLAGGVQRFSFPHSDLVVKLGGVTLKPGFALGSYAAFMPAPDQAVVMGDYVLTEPEVEPVMNAIQQHGLDVTAVHNHFIGEQPKLIAVHYLGHGDPVALARAFRSGLEATSIPLQPPSPPAASDLGFDPTQLDRIFGRPGTVAGGLYKQFIARAEQVKMQPDGSQAGQQQVALTPTLGLGTAISFQPLGGGQAAIGGDFAMAGPEVAHVVSALRAAGIHVNAIHSHMTDDQPHLYYLHFFATGDATHLAQQLRTALDQTHTAAE